MSLNRSSLSPTRETDFAKVDIINPFRNCHISHFLFSSRPYHSSACKYTTIMKPKTTRFAWGWTIPSTLLLALLGCNTLFARDFAYYFREIQNSSFHSCFFLSVKDQRTPFNEHRWWWFMLFFSSTSYFLGTCLRYEMDFSCGQRSLVGRRWCKKCSIVQRC